MDDLITARLLLHPLSPTEAEALVRGAPPGGAPPGGAPPGGVRWAPGYPADADIAGARRYLDVCATNGDPQPFGPYEIRRREDGDVIGGLGFHGRPERDGSVTIGYGVVPAVRGAGYATEALRALIDLARGHGITRVKGDTDHSNVASQRVMIAAGMRLAEADEQLKYYVAELA